MHLYVRLNGFHSRVIGNKFTRLNVPYFKPVYNATCINSILKCEPSQRLIFSFLNLPTRIETKNSFYRFIWNPLYFREKLQLREEIALRNTRQSSLSQRAWKKGFPFFGPHLFNDLSVDLREIGFFKGFNTIL